MLINIWLQTLRGHIEQVKWVMKQKITPVKITAGQAISAEQAKQLIVSGQAPAGLIVQGTLNLSNLPKLSALPDHLTVDGLDVSQCHNLHSLPAGLWVKGRLSVAGCKNLHTLPADLAGQELNTLDVSNCPNLHSLPEGLRISGRLILSGCTNLKTLPADLTCYELVAHESGLVEIPAGIQAKFRMDFTDCRYLEKLPDGLQVNSLVLRNCVSLAALPNGLQAYFLDVSGCVNLREWPLFAQLKVGRFMARNCPQLLQLPVWINQLAQLDVRGCVNLTSLPEQLQVASWLDIGSTQIKSLPAGCQKAELRWNGVPINQRIAFQPETIQVSEVWAEANVERRRVLMERMGYERFLDEAKPEQLDQDQDPGGVRRLLKVVVPGDEDLVCLGVSCPSTGRKYLIRVPPYMTSCHQAAAWIAGFDDPSLYAPRKET